MMKKGFTLIELVIYLGLSVALLFSVETLYFALKSAGLKQQAIAEVEQGGGEAMQSMTQTIRNARLVVAPATSTTAATLTLLTYLASTSPTVFSLATGTLYIKEGANAQVALTGPQITVYNMSFANQSNASTSGSIRLTFTAEFASTTQQFDTTYSKLFYGTASLRRLQQ